MKDPEIDSCAVLITCEHGGNRVPAAYRALFEPHGEVLATHRGWDPGALTLAREMAAAFGAPLFASTTTRLLIDMNRSIGTRQLYSEFTRTLSAAARREIVAGHYRPHLDGVEAWVRATLREGRKVVHIASHSFTPEIDGQVRSADIGLLYDPGRRGEVGFSTLWIDALHRLRPELRLRRNYPYLGKGDGLTARLRRAYPDEAYVGIELEVNQQFVSRGGRPWPKLRATIIESLRSTLAAAPADPALLPSAAPRR